MRAPKNLENRQSSVSWNSFAPPSRNLPCDDVQAHGLPPDIVPVPAAHVRIFTRLHAEVVARGLKLPRAARDIDALCGAVEGCGVVEALEAGGEGADGIERREC
jgi:hypothetical protein